MRRMAGLAAVWIGACGGGVAVPAVVAPTEVRLGALPEEAVVMGCSCTFEADGAIVLSGEVDESVYHAVIDGVRRTFRADGAGTWRDGDLTLRMVETASRPCAPDMPECEAVGSTRTVTLTRGADTVFTGIVDGACGC